MAAISGVWLVVKIYPTLMTGGSLADAEIQKDKSIRTLKAVLQKARIRKTSKKFKSVIDTANGRFATNDA
jgi:hypothetical protein